MTTPEKYPISPAKSPIWPRRAAFPATSSPTWKITLSGLLYQRVRPLLAPVLFLSLITHGYCDPVQTVDLSGTWNFTPQGQSQTTIQVPGGGWYKQGFTGISEADYSRSITIPNTGQPQVTILKFGAVNYEADVYINNTLVGTSIQSFTPASFNLSSFVTPGGTYTLRVHVKGRNAFMSGGRSVVPNAAGWSPNTPQGIFRSAQLLVYPQVYISDVFVRPSVQNNNLYYDVWLYNGSSASKTVTLSGNLTSWNGSGWSYPALPSPQYVLSANSETKVTIGPVNWNLGSDSYWWPNVPYQSGYTAQLHNLNLSLSGDSTDSSTTRFGFRECKQTPDGQGNTIYTLNGIRVNFRGDNIQGADYDSINYGGGPSDAYDTLPGFLPGANGWPQAVDNYQRLNYNFVRLHQEPVTPYMLDVCDEMGLMLMEETAIRGSANDQDFVNGHDNMVNHLKALYTRDRNHPAIVRQSLSNEPNQSSTDSTSFETDLYNAAMAVDGTRPVSIDVGTPAYTYETMTYSNFSVYRHYGTGNQFGQYTENVFARPDRPYGEGEFIWPADSSAQGFCWFGTASQAMRAQGASDIRPYTLLSAWASFVPGVNKADMTLEQGGSPVFGEDNLPDPWNNAIVQRVQAAFNPLLVADSNYWADVKLSNASGEWPANVPFLAANTSVTRTLTIYNDTFSGTAIDVHWELRQDSPTGTLAASGVVNATVQLGYPASQNINFTTPNAPNGTIYYLVLYAVKNGVEVFRENDEHFLMLNLSKLSGTAFGASPPYEVGSEFDKATDGDLSTFYDYSQANGGYTGIDLGAGNAQSVTFIVFTPRSGFESRMVGGQFLGSNNGSSYSPIYTVPSQPSGTTTVMLNSPTAYRYLEYKGPNGSYCNIAEMAFYSLVGLPTTPLDLVATGGNNGQVPLNWSAAYGATSYNVKRSLTSGGSYVTIAPNVSGTTYTDTSVANGTTYYYTVSAVNGPGESGNSLEDQATPGGAASLLARYPFDDNASDVSGKGNKAMLMASPGFSTGHYGQALILNGAGQYAKVPAGIMANAASFTIAAWVYWNGGSAWQRIFDFGNDTTSYMFLTPHSAGGAMRFAITSSGSQNEQAVETAPLPVHQWVHVAVTYNGSVATLYVNGGFQNSGSVSLSPANFNPAANYLGKSQWPSDPYFSGRLDDVCIYNYALSNLQIQQLMSTGPTAPGVLTNGISGNTLTLSWPAGQGWRLQTRTNLMLGDWQDISDAGINNTNIPIDPAKPAAFYRLVFP